MEIIPIIGIKSHNVGDLVSNGYAMYMSVGEEHGSMCVHVHTHTK